MNVKSKPSDDPLARRVRDVVDLVNRLRSRVSGLESELKAAHRQAEEARARLEAMEGERGQARQQVQRALELIHG